MPDLISSVSNAIQLELQEDTRYDHVIVRSGSYSYKVYPHERFMTFGDLEAVKKLAAPNEQTNGAVMRIATVYDEVLAEKHGFKNRCYFVRVVSAGPNTDPDRLQAGHYYELSTVGWATELETQEPCDPEFRMAWLDACDVMPDEIEPGHIFIRGFFETTNARYDPEQEFMFVRNELADYSATAQLIERHWARYGAGSIPDFEQTELPGIVYPQKSPSQLIEEGMFSEKITVQFHEQLDTYRLHSKMTVRQECVEEMCLDIKAIIVDRCIPESEIRKAAERREQEFGYQFAMSI
jgi:hypothetical protein